MHEWHLPKGLLAALQLGSGAAKKLVVHPSEMSYVALPKARISIRGCLAFYVRLRPQLSTLGNFCRARAIDS